MKKMILIGALALCPFACQETLEPLDPVVDHDDYSELARTLRLRNHAIRNGFDPATPDRALDDLIGKLQAGEQDPDLLAALAVLSGLLANNPGREVNQAVFW